MNAFMLGAGSSRGSFSEDWCVPMSSEFGACLSKVHPTWREAYPKISSAVEYLELGENWSLEPVWTAFDLHVKLPKVFEGTRLEYPDRQLKQALLDVYGVRCDELAGRINARATLVRLMSKSLSAGDVLISFNYDTIAERVASIHHRLSARRSPECVRLVKPHGSTSWNLNSENDVEVHCTSSGGPLFDSISSSRVGNAIEPLVVGAVPIKSELIREVQGAMQSDRVFDIVTEQWRAVVESIKHADALHVVGYSFPHEDRYGRFLVQEALRMRPKGKKLQIKFYEKAERCTSVAGAIRDVFGAHCDSLEYCGAVTPG